MIQNQRAHSRIEERKRSSMQFCNKAWPMELRESSNNGKEIDSRERGRRVERE